MRVPRGNRLEIALLVRRPVHVGGLPWGLERKENQDVLALIREEHVQ